MTNETTTALALPEGDTAPLDADAFDRVAREIAGNIAASIDQFYPGALPDRGLFNVKCWARGEVHRWFGKPDAVAAATSLDQRLRASAAHRRHIKRLRTIGGTVKPGDPIEPALAAMDASQRQASVEYRAGGPVIEGDNDA